MANIAAGIGPGGQTVPLAATPDGQLMVASEPEDTSETDALMELRAIRIGLEMMVGVKTGELLQEAMKSR